MKKSKKIDAVKDDTVKKSKKIDTVKDDTVKDNKDDTRITGTTIATREENGNILLKEDVFTRDLIIELLAEDMDIKEKLKIILEKGVPAYSTLVGKILGYCEYMTKTEYIESKIGASRNYDLYNTIKSILEENDYSEFKLKFDILNLAFIAYKDDALSDVSLNRFAEGWSRTTSSLLGYQIITTVIALLCDNATRESAKKLIGFSEIDKSLRDTDIFGTSAENLKKYYL